MSDIDTRIREYLRFIAVERGLAPNTVGAYRRDLERYATYLASIGVTRHAQVSEQAVAGFGAWLDAQAQHATLIARAADPDAAEVAPPTARTLARMLSSVRMFHRYLVAERLSDDDPSANVPIPKLGRSLPKALTVDQMRNLLDVVSGDSPEDVRDLALIELLYATGARISEIVALDVDDIADPEFVRVRGKGSKQRLVPVGSYANLAMQAYLVRVRPDWASLGDGGPALFLGIRGARLSRQSAWHRIRRAAERAGLSAHVSPHTLRHSFATHLVQGGADVRVVQELLGHASVATTQIYTLVTADALREMFATAHPRAR